MSQFFRACDHEEWRKCGLQNYEDYSECIEYVNQSEYGDDQLEGEWFFIPDEALADGDRVIYHGTFGNYNSPGSSHATYANVYDMNDPDDVGELIRDRDTWEGQEEYANDEPDEDNFDVFRDGHEPWSREE